MDAKKVLEVVAQYRRFFEGRGVPQREAAAGERGSGAQEVLMHCHRMLNQIEAFIRAGRVEKAHRWLGFIQGALWASGFFSIDEFKNHNRS